MGDVLRLFYFAKSVETKTKLASLIGNLLPNNKIVQNYFLKAGLFSFLNEIKDCSNDRLLEKYCFIITSFLTGDFGDPKRIFIEQFQGIELLKYIISKNNLKRAQRRALLALGELLKVEETEELKDIRSKALEYFKKTELKDIIVCLPEFATPNGDVREAVYLLIPFICSFDEAAKYLSTYSKGLSESNLDQETKKYEEEMIQTALIRAKELITV